VLHIQNISEFDNRHQSLPRFVKEFSIQPREVKQIEFLALTSRTEEYVGNIVLCGPVGPGWGGNFVALPCGSYDIELRIGLADGDPTRILCRVWIDGNELKAAERVVS
jgi:hypothetical protein